MTFDATVAGSTANSYLSTAAADALAAGDAGPGAAAWLATDVPSQQKVLQRATREVNAYLRSSGIARYSATQALLYPRAVDVLSNTPFIPTPVQFATYAQAKFLNVNAAVLDAAQARKARGIDSGSEPNVSWSARSMPADVPFLCDQALGFLQGIYGRAATVRSVVIGTAYTYPVLGDPGLDVLP